MEGPSANVPTALRSPRLALAAVALLGLLAYANTLTNPFVWDDLELIRDRPFLHDLANLPRLLMAVPTQSYFEVSGEFYYRPLVTASYMVDWAVWNGAPVGFHLTNAALHIACSLLVTLLGWRLADRVAGTVAGALFAVHPIHTETVTLVTGRVDLWPTLGVLIAFVAFLRAREQQRPWPWLAVATLAYGLGLLGKEMAFTLPAVLLLWEWGRSASPRLPAVGAALRWHVPFWGVAGAYAVWRFGVLEPPGAAPAWFGGTPGTAALSTVPVVVHYLWLFLWPANLSLYHNFHIVHAPWEVRFLAAGAVLAGLTAGAWVLRRRMPVVLGSWVAFLVLLSPVMNLVPLKNPMAERYLYLPTVALCLAGGVLLGWGGARSAVARGLVIAALLALLARTAARNRDYSSEYRIYDRAVEIADRNADARYNRGLMAQRGGNLERAEQEYRAAVALSPRHRQALAGLAEVLYVRKRPTEALSYSDRALAAWPEAWEVHYDRGLILDAVGDPAAATAAYEAAAARNTGSLKVRLALVRAYRRAGRPADALALACAPAVAGGEEPAVILALQDECRALRAPAGGP